MDHGRPCAEDLEGWQDRESEGLHLQARLRSGQLTIPESALMAVYNSHSIMTVGGDIVLLKFIESIQVREDEELIVDKLKGDVVLSVRTISGKEHLVSMKTLWETLGGGTLHGKELAIAVCEKWLWINKP